MSRISHENFDLSGVDYNKYDIQFMMVNYVNDTPEEIYDYLYNANMDWLHMPDAKKCQGKYQENARAIKESTPLYLDLAKFITSFRYTNHVQILCYISEQELQDNELMGIRQAKCYVILNGIDETKNKEIQKNLDDLRNRIVPLGKKLLEQDERFVQIDYIRFIICTRQRYLKKSYDIMNGKNTIYQDFCMGNGRNSKKQKAVDVLRTTVVIWPKPIFDHIFNLGNYSLHIRIGGNGSLMRYE